MEKPKDVEAKIGTIEEVFWTDIKEKIEKDILQARRQICMNLHMIELCDVNIKKEQKV